jgi:hypothetical protein
VRAFARAALALAFAAGLTGCALLPLGTPVPDDQLPVGVRTVTPPAQLDLKAINSTTIPVVLDVNGKTWDMQPGSDRDLGIADLGALPWNVSFRTAGGRQLLAATVGDGDVWRIRNADGSVELHAPNARADLSCGQVRLVFNGVLHGPAPGHGTPGDCD